VLYHGGQGIVQQTKTRHSRRFLRDRKKDRKDAVLLEVKGAPLSGKQAATRRGAGGGGQHRPEKHKSKKSEDAAGGRKDRKKGRLRGKGT